MTLDARFAPDAPVVEAYLKAAATDHTGHRILDLAVWYAIAQNFINRKYIQFLGQPFRVHFFAVASSRFGKSSSLDFGFVRFLGEYRNRVGQELDSTFIDLSGQNTAAGLMDAMNDASDLYKHQILTAWVDETTYVFPKFMGRREQDIANLLSNVLFGRRDVRHVRERGSKKVDSVERPVINACFPATPDQYVDLMKGSSSSDILKRFILLSPEKRDGREATPFTRYTLKLESTIDTFCQWLNFLDVSAGTPSDPRAVNLSKEGYEKINDLFGERLKFSTSEAERDFFSTKQNSTLAVAALNALSRTSFEVNVEDVELAWHVLLFSWDSYARLADQQPMDEALTTTQRQRRLVVDRIVTVVKAAGKEGIQRATIRPKVWALRHFKSDEVDELFSYLDKEVPEVFSLLVDVADTTGRIYTKRIYYASSVWTPEEAACTVAVTKPVWSSAANGYVDSLGNVCPDLKSCVGYRLGWGDDLASSLSRAANGSN
jgi:hypothetical protein